MEMENEKITIEKIDAVIDRIPNVSYAEAKEALLLNEGDVVEAIIYLEVTKSGKGKKAKEAIGDIFGKDFAEDGEKIKSNVKETFEDVFGKDGENVKRQLKNLLKKSSVVRIIIEKDNKVMMNIPLTIGVVGMAFVPIASLIGISAAVITKYRIKIQNEEDGEIVDLGELNQEKLNILKNMIVNAAKDVKDVVVDKDPDEDLYKDKKDVTEEIMKEFGGQDNSKNDEGKDK